MHLRPALRNKSGLWQAWAVTWAARTGSSSREMRLRSENCILGRSLMRAAALDCLDNPLERLRALGLSWVFFSDVRQLRHSKELKRASKLPHFSILPLRLLPKAVVLPSHFTQKMCGWEVRRPVCLRRASSALITYFIVLMISELLLSIKNYSVLFFNPNGLTGSCFTHPTVKGFVVRSWIQNLTFFEKADSVIGWVIVTRSDNFDLHCSNNIGTFNGCQARTGYHARELWLVLHPDTRQRSQVPFLHDCACLRKSSRHILSNRNPNTS